MYAVIEQDDGGCPRDCTVFHTWEEALDEAARLVLAANIMDEEDADSVRQLLDDEGWITDGGWTVSIVEATVRARKAVSHE